MVYAINQPVRKYGLVLVSQDGEKIEIFFSECRNGRWISEKKLCIRFDYLDYYDLLVCRTDVERDVWRMLLQVLDLKAT